jgi:hypothetical protein
MFIRLATKTVFLSFILSTGIFVLAQTPDSINTKDSLSYRQELDSLKAVVDSLNLKLTSIKKRLEKQTPLDSLLTGFEDFRDTSSIPEDQRSRRKQLDALLELISQRPGQLFFNGQVNTIIQGNLPEDNQFATATGSVNLFASASFENNIILFMDLEAIGGNGPDEFAETLKSLNGDAGSTQSADGFDRIVVNEVWTEFLFLNKIFTITAGKIDLTNYFDNNAIANDENSQFISSSLINNTAFAVPSNSPGFRIRTSILDRFYIQFAMVKTENSGKNIFDNLYKIGGIGFKILPNSDYTAEFHLFGYSHPLSNSSFGFGVSMSQTIAARFTIFGRFANNENELAEWYRIKNSWSTGAQFIENLIEEPSIIGIAYGSTKPFDQIFKNEKLTELYIRQMINQWISLSVHYQYVWDTFGIDDKYSILGLRVNFTF